MGPDHLFTLLSAALASFMVFYTGPNPDPIPWYNTLAHLQLEAGFRFFPPVSFTPSLPPSTRFIPTGPICLTTDYRPLLERTPPPPPPPSVSPSLRDLVSRIVSLTPEDILRELEGSWVWSASRFHQGIEMLHKASMVLNDVRIANPTEFDIGVVCFFLVCWMITIKVIASMAFKAVNTFKEPPEAREINLQDINPSSSSLTSDPIISTPSLIPPLTASLSLPHVHSLAPLRPIVTLPPLPRFSVTDRYNKATATPVAIHPTMCLADTSPARSTEPDAIEPTITFNIGTEEGPSLSKNEGRSVSGSVVTTSTYPPVPTPTAAVIPVLTQRRMPTDEDISLDDLPLSVTVDSLQDFGEVNAPVQPPKVLFLLEALKFLDPVDMALSSSSPSSDHASSTTASTLSGAVGNSRGSVSGIATAEESNEAQLSAPLSPLKMFEFPRCCGLQDSDFIPAWGSYNFGSCWLAPEPTSLFRPQDGDGERPSTRIAVDNIVYSARGAHGNTDTLVFRNRAVDDALGSLDLKSKSCYWPRIVGGVPDRQMSYAVVDFGSVEEAERAFRTFQGRRVNVNSRHWRLEFLDPADRTLGGRRKLDPT